MPAIEEFQIEYGDFGKLLVSLLENDIVDQVVGYKIAKPERRYIVNALKMDAKNIDDLLEFPLSQIMTYNYARTDSAAKYLHGKMGGALDKRVAMVGRPCDARALVELGKRVQVNRENVFSIIIEDQGRMGTKPLMKFFKKPDIDLTKVTRERVIDQKLVLYMDDGSTTELELGEALDFDDNCKRCFRKVPPAADLTVSDLGIPKDSSKLYIAAWSERGLEALQKSGVTLEKLPGDVKSKKESLQKELVDAARARREKDLAAFKDAEDKIPRLLKCTMCGMCIRACPVCFCKDCILQKKRKAKSIDKVSYQLTRIAHVADSCVGCGACDINCPMNLPLSLYFQTINDNLADSYKFVAGQKPEDDPPRSGAEIKKLAAQGAH